MLKDRMLGSAAYHLCKVADGTALAGVESAPKVWDLAAATLILEEAGGQFMTVDRQRVFPLPPTLKDYCDLTYPVVAAASTATINELLDGITPVKR